MEYLVTMPIAGTVSVEVEADSPEEAKEKFYEKCDDFKLIPNNDEVETEWSFYEWAIATGRGQVHGSHVWDTEMTIEEV
tara:strand:+ start:10077 stop:10313 length:237 start_codon:yes stop_codon:yes gene_type:complete